MALHTRQSAKPAGRRSDRAAGPASGSAPDPAAALGGPTAGSGPGRVAAPTAQATRLRRNPKWIALGIVALCLGALGSFFLYNQISEAREVVGIRHSVARGMAVTAGDLTVVRVGNTPGIATVPAGQLDSLVGEYATADLTQNTLLAPGLIAPVLEPAAGRSLVGVKLDTGRAPQGHLTPGSPIRLIAVPPTGAAADYSDSYTGLSIEGIVIGVSDNPDGQSILLNVDVASDQSTQAATLAAASRLVAIRDPQH